MVLYINGEKYEKPGKALKVSTILRDAKLKKKLKFNAINQSSFIRKLLASKKLKEDK